MRAKLLMGLTILSSPLLTACDHNVRIATPPPELLECDPMPIPPELPPQSAETQRVRDLLTLGHIIALRTAYGSCAGNLAGVRVWREKVSR